MSVEPEWEPGVPLHSRNSAHYRGFLYNFRDDTDRGEHCSCPDAARWPVPKSSHALSERDDIPRGSAEVA